MAQAKVMNGARARMAVGKNIVGIFNSVSYGLNIDAQPINILGSFPPVEITYTGVEAVAVTATGWRVIGHGPHDANGPQVPKLQELLRHEDITLSIFDRQDDTTPVMVLTGVRPTGYSTSMDARGAQQITVNFLGIQLSDESGPQADIGASKLP